MRSMPLAAMCRSQSPVELDDGLCLGTVIIIKFHYPACVHPERTSFVNRHVKQMAYKQADISLMAEQQRILAVFTSSPGRDFCLTFTSSPASPPGILTSFAPQEKPFQNSGYLSIISSLLIISVLPLSISLSLLSTMICSLLAAKTYQYFNLPPEAVSPPRYLSNYLYISTYYLHLHASPPLLHTTKKHAL